MLKSHLPASGNPLDLEVSRLRKTYSTEPVEIEGIIGESPQSTMTSRVFGGGYRIHLFSFAAWRLGAEAIRTDELLVSRAIPNKGSFRYQLDLYGYARLKVLLSADQTRAVMVQGMEASDCPDDFAAIAADLAKDVTLEHHRFGMLTLDRGLHCFSGTTMWNGSDIEITLPADGKQLDSELTKRAEFVFDAEEEFDQRVKSFLVASVIAEHDDELTSEEIKSRVALEGINLSETGSVEFWYDDDGLWGEHSLIVRFVPGDEAMSFSVEG